MRPHPRYAETDPSNPRAWATCERCGFQWNLFRLDWQMEWRGNRVENTRHLVCPNCMDIPQRQLGVIILPPDPLPVMNARPEQYSMDEEPVSARFTMDGRYREISTDYNAENVTTPYRIVAGGVASPSVGGSPSGGGGGGGGGGGTGADLLVEDSSLLLLEDGSAMILG